MQLFKFDPKARPIWEIAAEISAQIPDLEWAKVPTDLAKNFDKYQTKAAKCAPSKSLFDG